MNKILITGGAGYIGSHTCKLLHQFGFEPITYDNLSTGIRDFVRWGPLVEGDILDTQKLENCIRKYSPIAVIHFAASAYVGESMTDPFKYYLNNVGGTLSLINAMLRNNLKKIVFSSTCATYGISDTKLINEMTPQSPINPYGQSKLMIEKLMSDMSKQNQLNFISLRYFNAAGADFETEIGESHDPESHLIPLAIYSALHGQNLQIYGTDFDTPDGTAVRDYIHVEDLAHAHILSVKYLLDGKPSDFFNLGTGKGTSVKHIVERLNEMGLDVRSVKTQRRLGDPPYLIADSLKANNILGWNAKYNIDEILTSAINWHKKNI